MAIAILSDFKIYDEQFFGGVSEVLAQNANGFNGASNNALRLIPRRLIGQYEKESFFQIISNLVARRDPTSTASATALKPTQAENIGVKLNRKIGPVDATLDSFKKLGLGEMSPEEFSALIGEQAGKAIAVDYINSGIRAIDAAIRGVAALNYDQTANATKTLTHTALVQGLAKFGDAAGQIVCWVMHSKAYFDLVGQAITDKIFEVGAMAVMQGITPTLNRPVLVIDSPALVTTTSAGTTYNTLGLTENSLVMSESEDRSIVSEIVTGLENLVVRMQGEYALNVMCKGYQWDVANGGANPNDAALATATNWDKVATENKSTAGVAIKTQ